MSRTFLPSPLGYVWPWLTPPRAFFAISFSDFGTKPEKQKTNGSLIKMKGELNWATKHENEWIYSANYFHPPTRLNSQFISLMGKTWKWNGWHIIVSLSSLLLPGLNLPRRECKWEREKVIISVKSQCEHCGWTGSFSIIIAHSTAQFSQKPS